MLPTATSTATAGPTDAKPTVVVVSTVVVSTVAASTPVATFAPTKIASNKPPVTSAVVAPSARTDIPLPTSTATAKPTAIQTAETGAAAQLPPTGVNLNGIQVWITMVGAFMLVALLVLSDRHQSHRRRAR